MMAETPPYRAVHQLERFAAGWPDGRAVQRVHRVQAAQSRGDIDRRRATGSGIHLVRNPSTRPAASVALAPEITGKDKVTPSNANTLAGWPVKRSRAINGAAIKAVEHYAERIGKPFNFANQEWLRLGSDARFDGDHLATGKGRAGNRMSPGPNQAGADWIEAKKTPLLAASSIAVIFSRSPPGVVSVRFRLSARWCRDWRWAHQCGSRGAGRCGLSAWEPARFAPPHWARRSECLTKGWPKTRRCVVAAIYHRSSLHGGVYRAHLCQCTPKRRLAEKSEGSTHKSTYQVLRLEHGWPQVQLQVSEGSAATSAAPLTLRSFDHSLEDDPLPKPHRDDCARHRATGFRRCRSIGGVTIVTADFSRTRCQK